MPHPLIIHTLKRFNVPAEIQFYINTLYNNQLSRIFTDKFSTHRFPFKRGVFQSDPLGPIIFLMFFNPIIKFLQSKNDCGFNLNGDKIITLLVLVSKQCAIIYQSINLSMMTALHAVIIPHF